MMQCHLAAGPTAFNRQNRTSRLMEVRLIYKKKNFMLSFKQSTKSWHFEDPVIKSP